MKAIRVYVDTKNTDLIGRVVEQLNDFEDIVATMASENEIFIAAHGESAIEDAKCIVHFAFGDTTVKTVK